MTLRKSLFALCLASSAACIAVGYAMIGAWLGACLILLPCVPAAFHRKLSAHWLPTVFLFCTVGFAAAGLLLGTPAFTMIAGAALALGTWDLANLERAIEDGGGASAPRSGAERRHVLLLGCALGAGLIAAAAALVVPLRLPFIAMLPLVILDLFCLERLARYYAASRRGTNVKNP
jgi:hypothetical protein